MGRIAASERRERVEASPERVASRARVRRVQLESRSARGTAGGFLGGAVLGHGRAAVAWLDGGVGVWGWWRRSRCGMCGWVGMW